VAIVVSTAISPLADWLQRRGLARAGAVALIYLGLLGLAAAFAWAVGPTVAEQATAVAGQVEGYYQDLLNWLHTSPSLLVQRLSWQLPARLAPAPPPGGAGERTLDALAQMLAYAGLVGDGLFVFAAVLLLAFYWTLERERVLRWLLLLLPIERRDPARDLVAATEAKVGAYLRGVAVLSLAVGGLAVTAFALLGLPSALLLGVTAGLFEAVPLVGPVLGALPAVLVAFSIDPALGLWTAGVAGLIQLAENTILVPRIMGRAVGVNPLVTLLALAAFGGLFGLAGAVLAIPLAAVIQMLLDRYVFGANAADWQAPQGRGRLSLLRYEVQDLVRDVRKQAREKPAEAGDDADPIEEKVEAIASDLDSLLARWTEETSR
jgi:predicted PurR-regulated permease PerM